MYTGADGGYVRSSEIDFVSGRAGDTISSTSAPGEIIFATTADSSTTIRGRGRFNSYGGFRIDTDAGTTYSAVACSVDSIELGSIDLSAGNTQLYLKTEGTCVITTGGITQSAVIAIRHNDTQYYLFASTAIA